MSEVQKKGLGRGLSALLGEESEDYAALDKHRQTKMVPIEFLHANPYQPRRYFDDEKMRSLVESIRTKGVLQPILVRRHREKPNEYYIVAGERRWRASQKAQLHEVPVVIKDLTDQEALEIALIENIQRQDLSVLEEAKGYQRLMDEFHYTQEQLAEGVGKSRSHVANLLRLLQLPEDVKSMLHNDQISMGHARALLGAENPSSLAKECIEKGWSVRQLEAAIRISHPEKSATSLKGAAGKASDAKPSGGQGAARSGGASHVTKDPDSLALERDLSQLLGLKVTLDLENEGEGGTLMIHYQTLDQLDDILAKLKK